MASDAPSGEYDAQLARGAVVNFAGLVGKLLYPLLVVFIAWLIGPEQLGLYLLVVFISDVAVSAVSTGASAGSTNCVTDVWMPPVHTAVMDTPNRRRKNPTTPPDVSCAAACGCAAGAALRALRSPAPLPRRGS